MNMLRRTKIIKEYIFLPSRLLHRQQTITEMFYNNVIQPLKLKENNSKTGSKRIISKLSPKKKTKIIDNTITPKKRTNVAESISPRKKVTMLIRNFETEMLHGPIKRTKIIPELLGLKKRTNIMRNFETKALYGPLLVTASQKRSFLNNWEVTLSKKFPSDVVKFNGESVLLFGPMIRKRSKKSNSLKPTKNINVKEDKLPKLVHYKTQNKVEDVHCALPQTKINQEVLMNNSVTEPHLSSGPEKTLKPVLNLQLGKTLLSSQVLKTFPLFNPSRSSDNQVEASIISHQLPLITNTTKFPSVTAILKNTMPPESVMILERWKERMIKQLGEEGFLKYNQETLRQGIVLHTSIKELLSGKSKSDIIIDPKNEGHWHSLSYIFDKISDIKVLEGFMEHPYLCYTGASDCVAKYRDKLCLIDWKTSQKPKPFLTSTFDNPLQIAAYVGALNFDKNYSFQVKDALIVIAYQNGDPAHAHFMTADLCMKYWCNWLKRLETFWENKVAESEV